MSAYQRRISDWSSDTCSAYLNAKIHWTSVAQYELLGMDLQAMSPSPACQRCCLVPGLSESHQLGFSKRRDKMISDDGSGTKIRVRYWITSVKQPRDFSQGRRSCGQPTSSMCCEPLTIER